MKIRTCGEKILSKIKRSDKLGKPYVQLRLIPMRILQNRFRMKYFRHPIQQNKIIFVWYKNEKFSCNMKAIVQKLLEQDSEKYDIVCCFSNENFFSDVPAGARCITYNSPNAEFEFATAKIWFMNDTTTQIFHKGITKREGQYAFQTWHGSLGIKTIGKAAAIANRNHWHVYVVNKVSEWYDYWISNSTFETNVYKTSFSCVNEILLYGHPRNDVLVNNGNKIDPKIKHLFDLDNKKILLYAPSHRNDLRTDCYNIDRKLLIEALHDRFGGEWVIMYRLHPRLKQFGGKKLIPDSELMIDATDYPDIQDLMLGVDAMLTDFSSCIFDFMLSGRPGFIYTPDLDTYQLDRGFYYPLESVPFPIGKTNQELAEKIRSFDPEKYKCDLNAFLSDKGCMEDGHAAERVVHKIDEIMKS